MKFGAIPFLLAKTNIDKIPWLLSASSCCSLRSGQNRCLDVDDNEKEKKRSILGGYGWVIFIQQNLFPLLSPRLLSNKYNKSFDLSMMFRLEIEEKDEEKEEIEAKRFDQCLLSKVFVRH